MRKIKVYILALVLYLLYFCYWWEKSSQGFGCLGRPLDRFNTLLLKIFGVSGLEVFSEMCYGNSVGALILTLPQVLFPTSQPQVFEVTYLSLLAMSEALGRDRYQPSTEDPCLNIYSIFMLIYADYAIVTAPIQLY